MTEFIKKSCVYFAGAIAFLITVKASFDIVITWPVIVAIVVFVGLACATIAWVEVWGWTWRSSRASQGGSNGASVSLSISRALAKVKYAARDDESIALEANRIVRRYLDKRCISYKEYRTWRRKNPYVFTAVTDSDGRLLGFFDVFPLTDDAATGLLNGWLREHDLTIDSILPSERNADAKSIYIASIMENPQQETYSHILARELVILKCLEYLVATFPPTDNRTIFAYAQTEMGERLLRNAQFTNTALTRDSKQRRPLYELPPVAYKELARTFQTTSGIRPSPMSVPSGKLGGLRASPDAPAKASAEDTSHIPDAPNRRAAP